MFTDLLKEALRDIDSLKTYYESQRKSVYAYVTSNIDKYKYGIILDRFFMKQILDSEDIVISNEEARIIEEVLEDYKTEMKENGTVVSYQLKSDVDFSGYEMDPEKSRDGYIKLIQQPEILIDSMIIMLLIKYEEAISGIYRYMLGKYPQAYLSDKSITFAELLMIESDLDQIKDKFISKEIEDFMRQPISDWYKSFETKQKVSFPFQKGQYDRFKEIYYRRNLIVHNQGVVNDIYVRNVKNCTLEIGRRIQTDDKYLHDAFFETQKMVIATFWGLRKVGEDKKRLHEYLFEYGYDCLKRKDWEFAEYIYDTLLEDAEEQAVADKICEQVNRWIAIKNFKGIEAIKEEVEMLDVSAMKTQFSLAKAALLDKCGDISTYLEVAVPREISIKAVKEWPLLDQYRESSEYQDFMERHKDLFKTEEYESDNETVEAASEIIAEIDKCME